jgi:GAF domain-containing protein
MTLTQQEPSIVLDHNLGAAATVIERLADGKYCTLLGPHSSGKTTVLRFARRELARRRELCCIYLSLAEVDTVSREAFFSSLARAVSRLVLADYPPGAVTIPSAGRLSFRAFVEVTIAALGRDLVLMLDDLEQVPSDLLSVLLSSLRAMYMEQERAGPGRRLVVVVAGALSLAGLTVRETSPFYGIALPVHLGDLADEDSLRILDRQLAKIGRVASDHVRNSLLQKVRGNANLIRAFCRRLASDDGEGPTRLTARRVHLEAERFLREEAASYQPLQEAVRLVEEDPDLLICVLMLLRRPAVPRRELPLGLTTDYDPLYLTGIVRRCPDGSYQLHNEIYRRFFELHFSPNRVSQLLTTAGRWDEAIDYLVERVRAGDAASRAELLSTTITALYTVADDVERAGQLIVRALTAVFGAQEVTVWLMAEDQRHLRSVFASRPVNGKGASHMIDVSSAQLEAQALQEIYPIRVQEGERVRRAAALWVKEGRPLGVLSMLEASGDGVSGGRDAVARLESFLRQAARGLHEVIERNRRSESLRDISRAFSGLLLPEQVLKITLDQLAQAVPFDSASIQYRDRSGSVLEIAECRGFADPDEVRRIRFPLADDAYPNVQVLRQRAPQRLANIHDACPHLGEPGFAHMAGVRGWMAVPLVVGDDAIGVVTLDSRTADIYTLEHENTAMLIASMAAVAIQRARLHDRQIQEKHLINAAAQMTGSVQDLDQTWRRILLGAIELTGAEAGNISQVDEESGLMIDRMQRGFPATLATVRALDATSVQAWVAKHRRSALIFDIEREPQWEGIYVPGREGTRSELAVPILRGGAGRVVGIINLECSRPNAFTADDRRLLEELAVIADLALSNALHYYELAKQRQELEKQQQKLNALYRSAQMITQAGLEIDAVLQAILDQAISVTGGAFGTIQLVEEGELVFRATWPLGQKAALLDNVGRMPLDGGGITVRAVRQGRAQLVPDICKDPDYVEGDGRTRCELVVPLMHNGRPKGVLNIEHPEPYHFHQGDLELLEGLADLAVVALLNAERYKELEHIKDVKLASQAVAWLGLFGADWQHTINQKISSIQGFVNGLLEVIARKPAEPSTLELTRNVLQRIGTVAGSIRAVPFTSQVPAVPGTSEVPTCVDDDLPQFVDRLCHERRDVELRWSLRCPGVEVGIHPQWLRVAMEKLITNALRAMPAGGTLTVTTELRRDRVAVTVRDTGNGVPPEVQPYFLKSTVPRMTPRSGSGMGALIARFIAVSYGGDLQLVRSEPGFGTELTMTLPVITGEGPPEAA